jgi:hypothetical protein
MPDFDRGPTVKMAKLFARVPDPPVKAHFWYDWGPIFYRGRLDKSARVLCLGSDPGPTERIGGRCLIGNAGQRVQGFLAKLGLTKSYVMLNAWAYALIPDFANQEESRLDDPEQVSWRNELYDAVCGPKLQAIVAFGVMAQKAARQWTSRPAVELVGVPHPSSRDEDKLLAAWSAAVTKLRAIVTPDTDGDATGPNYGATFAEADHAPVPRRDLPYGMPEFLGDDRWLRTQPGAPKSAVQRPSPDDRHTLIWRAPTSNDA